MQNHIKIEAPDQSFIIEFTPDINCTLTNYSPVITFIKPQSEFYQNNYRGLSNEIIKAYNDFLISAGYEYPIDYSYEPIYRYVYKANVWKRPILADILYEAISNEDYKLAALVKRELTYLPFGPVSESVKWDKENRLKLMYINRSGRWIDF